MTSSDPRVAPTLKESIVIICKQAGGYFNAWPELISLLAAHLAQKNYAVSIELYHLIKKIIQRYRIEMKSYDLFEEIKLTIKHIAHIFTEDAVTCSQFLFSEEKNNQAMALSYIKMFRYIMSIFFSINFQDFPEYFEDNLKTWIEILKSGIAFDIPLFNKECLNEVIKLKTAVMKSINLYHNNYYEDIQDYVGEFYPLIWNLAIFVKNEDDYSKLVREILDYYKISFQYRRASGFSNETIQHLIDKLIIPNMQMTRQELDDYEENPTNFLKVELEEADMDSSKINFYP